MTRENKLKADESLIIKPYYVYVLADPLCNNDVFYVGKGKSQRGFDHLKDALKPDIADTSKIVRIRSILEKDSEPLVRVIARFDTQEESFAVESVLIHWVYGYDALSNEQSGHGSRYVRPKLRGLDISLPSIDIPKKIKMIGTMTNGYLQDKIDNHLRLNHAEMMQDLYDFLNAKDVSLNPDGVAFLESGRYLAIIIQLNMSANLVLQITDSEKHSIIPNLRSVSDRKEDRESFTHFVASVFGVESNNYGRYAKLSGWKQLKISVEEH
jgi:hypothetical protein